MSNPCRCALLVATSLALVSPGAAATYRFTKIADASGYISRNFHYAAINSSGAVAFTESANGIIKIVNLADGGRIVALDHQNAPPGFGWMSDYVSINDSGSVAYAKSTGPAQWPNPAPGAIFVRNGEQLITVAENSSGPFSGIDDRPSINNSGLVSFRGTLRDGQNGIFRYDGGSIATIIESADTFTRFGHTFIDDEGTVAFRALFATERGFYSGDGGMVAPIATISHGIRGLIRDHYSINAHGVVAFVLENASYDVGIYIAKDGVLTPIAHTSGPFSWFGSSEEGLGYNTSPAINSRGGVAFLAGLHRGAIGIYSGGDPVAQKVIETGDQLFGSVVETLNFHGALNDRGQVAFTYSLANDIEGLAVATPVPEPATGVLMTVALALAMIGNRHRYDCCNKRQTSAL